MNDVEFYDKTNEFNVWLGPGERGEPTRKKVQGISRVDLPEIRVDTVGQIMSPAVVRLWFNGISDAVAFVKENENLLRVRVAEQYAGLDNTASFTGWEHALVVYKENQTLYLGSIERGEPQRVCVALPVRDYTMMCEGEEVYHAREYCGDC